MPRDEKIAGAYAYRPENEKRIEIGRLEKALYYAEGRENVHKEEHDGAEHTVIEKYLEDIHFYYPRVRAASRAEEGEVDLFLPHGKRLFQLILPAAEYRVGDILVFLVYLSDMTEGGGYAARHLAAAEEEQERKDGGDRDDEKDEP